MPMSNELPNYDQWKGREPDAGPERFAPVGEAPLTALLRHAEGYKLSLGGPVFQWLSRHAHLLDEGLQDELAILLAEQLRQLNNWWIPLTFAEAEAERERARDYAADRAEAEQVDRGRHP